MEKKPKRRTRERILETSLQLFNDFGEPNVTTQLISDEMGISPGNLYYHFRNKDQIVEQLFERFEARIALEPDARLDGPEAIEDLWLYLHLMFEGIWAYRFLYRNLDDIVGRNRRLREHFNRIVEAKLEAVRRLCEGLVKAGLMQARPEDIRALADNVLVVATYWLNYRAVRDRRGRTDSHDLGAGAFQVMALVAPYLVPEARSHIERLGRDYVD